MICFTVIGDKCSVTFQYFIHIWTPTTIKSFLLYKGPSWSWSYGSWIYNYLCNQCISPL